MKKSLVLAGSLGFLSIVGQGLPAFAGTSNLVSDLSEQDLDISQVTSVTQLSDVPPTDWAFQALQSLVERYGCIAGYPNGTFRGNRAATRYELAAALNACLDQISDRFATKEDLATVKALQEEFKTELATLKGRVDGLEARTSTLEAQQFSTTTKLQGEVVTAVQYGGDANDTRFPGATNKVDSRATAIARVRLNFNTSFNGNDLLQTQLEVGNGGSDLFGARDGNGDRILVDDGRSQTGSDLYNSGTIYYAGIPNTVRLRRLAYSFKPSKNLTLTIGPRLFPQDFVDFNSYANNSAQDFSSGFFINNPLIINNLIGIPGGAGAAVNWNVGGGPLSLRATYVAANPTNSVAAPLGFGGGLFGDPYQATAEVEYAKTFGAAKKSNFALRLQYTRSSTEDFHQNVVGVNTELTVGRFGVFGRAGYSIEPQFIDGNAGRIITNIRDGQRTDYFLTWQAGVGIRDILVPGSLFAVAAGQPFIVQNQVGPEQFNFEGFYRFPINDNITITPAVMVITDANNTQNSAIIQGVIRATFSF